MEQVSLSSSSTAPEVASWRPSRPKQTTACIRLKQGSSARATYLLEDTAGGTTITVGADPGCDWQIRAAGVANFALDLLLLGGNMFAKCPLDSTVLVDGRQLGSNWVEVTSGARIHIGLAQLELTMGEKASAFEHLPQAFDPSPRARVQDSLPRARVQDAQRTLVMGEEETIIVEPDLEVIRPDMEDELDLKKTTVFSPASEQDYRPSFVDPPTRPSLVERLSRASLFDRAPTLLDDGVESIPRRNLWRYALAAGATAVAYAGWLALLDTL